MKLIERLTELGYTETEDNVFKATGSDGKSDIFVALLDEGRVEVVKQPTETDIPATVITFSKDCDALTELLERWTWS
jgi:hypothetical protein